MNEAGNVVDIGEVRKGLSSIFKVSVGEYNGRTYVYCQLWKKEEEENGPGEKTRLGLTLRPEALRGLIPLFSKALEEAAARDERKTTLKNGRIL